MKLRLRRLAPRQTLGIAVHDSCTLPQLKQILSQTLPDSPSPASIRISLNRKDDLQSDGEETLHSLGITAGDLLYFSIEQQSATGTSSNSQNSLNTPPLSQNSDSVRGQITDGMDVDKEDSVDSYNSGDWVKSFTVPGYLRKMLKDVLGDDVRPNHKVVITAVDQVMKEFGLLGMYRNSNEQPLGLYRISLFYTLPGTSNPDYHKSINTVVLKFQTLGKFMNVYGSLKDGSGKTPTNYHVKVNMQQLLENLKVEWENGGQDAKFFDTSPDKEMLKFWKDVKDNLAYPLMIDLCEEAGLELPPCFAGLPKDLKMKILELLPGADVAKMSCLNSELRSLGSTDNLWKRKFAEEFSDEEKKRKRADESWKKAFATAWRSKKRCRTAFRDPAGLRPGPLPMIGRRWPAPNPFVWPRIVGDDLDEIDRVFGVVGQLDRQMNRGFEPAWNLTRGRTLGGRVI